MLRLIYKILVGAKNKLRHFFFLYKYRKDTPESTEKFYNIMRYIYRAEFTKRENYCCLPINTNVSFYSKLSTPYDEIYNKSTKNVNYLQEVDKELIVPVNKKIRFLLTSNDVLHAWWVPDLALKKDAIPGYINEMSVVINEPGIYRGRCAELCGRHHGFMPIVIKAVEEKEYEEWLANAEKAKTSDVAKINK